MKTAIVIQHIAFEGLGNLKPALIDAGYQIAIINAASDDLSLAKNADLLVILGGPIGVYETSDYPFLIEEINIIKHAIKQNKPIIGICLGAQLIAKALGADVYSGKLKGLPKEIGFSALHSSTQIDNILIPLIENNIPVLHWHGDTFDLPEGARRLASSDIYPNQAFTYNENILALQFHFEVTALEFESWLVGHTGEINQMGLSVQALRADCKKYDAAIRVVAKDIWALWLQKIA